MEKYINIRIDICEPYVDKDGHERTCDVGLYEQKLFLGEHAFDLKKIIDAFNDAREPRDGNYNRREAEDASAFGTIKT